jgi:hypothetical protein
MVDQARLYWVKACRDDSSGKFFVRIETAYTAADALTQASLRVAGSYPKVRLVEVGPLTCAKRRELIDDGCLSAGEVPESECG